MRALPLVASALFVLAGCGGTPDVASGYAGTVWSLDRIVGADGTVTRGSGDERLTFGTDGRLALSSCNECGAPYRVADGTLTIGEAMACTRRACPEDAVELDRYVRETVTLRREGAFLVVESPGGPGATTQLLFVPEAPAAPAAPPAAP